MCGEFQSSPKLRPLWCQERQNSRTAIRLIGVFFPAWNKVTSLPGPPIENKAPNLAPSSISTFILQTPSSPHAIYNFLLAKTDQPENSLFKRFFCEKKNGCAYIDTLERVTKNGKFWSPIVLISQLTHRHWQIFNLSHKHLLSSRNANDTLWVAITC